MRCKELTTIVMPEKKRSEKIKMTTELEKVTTEILAINGRTREPFIKVFTYSGENITTSGLGTLTGVFEVTDHSEESAYIVNFLASVAKKEYFSNPRRGAIESFEASLHKINLALAELVKHGNIAWLGKLHGALGILEKNNIHFSATGKASILLLRNGRLSEISAGLASEESSAHPIKTFVEVSSGRLITGDKIILTSPALFTLLSPEDIEKNALRMENERFAQFLRTALINELDMAGTIIVDITLARSVAQPKKKAEKSTASLYNVFSQQAFNRDTRHHQREPSENITPQHTSLSAEYTDSKTGHIYVQGGTPTNTQGHPSVERIKLVLQDIGHTTGTFLSVYGKFLRKSKKQSLIVFDACKTFTLRTLQKSTLLIKKQLAKNSRKLNTKIRSLRNPKTPTITENVNQPVSHHAPASSVFTTSAPTYQKTRETILSPTTKTNNDDIPPFLREKLALFQQKRSVPQTPTIARASLSETTLPSKVLGALRYALRWWQNLNPKHRKTVLLSSSLLLILGIGIFAFTRPKETIIPTPANDTQEEPMSVSSLPPENEKNTALLAEPTTLTTTETTPLISVLLRDEAYLITNNDILSVRDQTHSVLPANSGTPLLAAAMNDIGFIFLYTDTQELLTWNPINRAFVKNTLTLPAGTVVKGMGTYLTYLYILDGAKNQIYRYPRAENGFGEPTVWLKDSLTLGDQPLITISENIFLAPTRETVQTFLQGRFVKNLESPNTPLAVTDIFTERNLTNVYALDNTNKRILVWNQDGTLLKQYFSEHLANATSIIVNEKTSEAFITTERSLLSFPLKP